MNNTLKLTLPGLAGILLGFVLGTYAAGQFVANATAERDAERDDLRDGHTDQVKSVIDAAAAKLGELRVERDDALAQLEALQPKTVASFDASGLSN